MDPIHNTEKNDEGLKKIKNHLDLAFSFKPFSEINFIKAVLKSNIQYLPTKNFSIDCNGSLGFIKTNNIYLIPDYLRLYTGGAHSLRGFSYQSIPEDKPGKILKEISIDLGAKIYENWWAKTFIDFGQVSNNISDKMHKDVGLGVQLNSQQVNIMLSIAKPIGKDSDKPWKLQLGVNF